MGVVNKPKRLLMAEEWNKFSRLTELHKVSDVQRKEMRRAFYSGAQAIMFRVMQSLSSDSEPTAEDVQVLENLHQELSSFARDVLEGRA